MATCVANWEDEENNRVVELSVEYQLADGRLEIGTVTPSAVVFVDAASEPVRKIRVWTEAGRRMLLKQYTNHVGLDRLQQELDGRLLAPAQ